MMMPQVKAPLDPGFQPLSIVYRAFLKDVKQSGSSQRFVIQITRSGGFSSSFEAEIYKDGVNDRENIRVMDRLVKSLLWVRGGFRITVSGSKAVYEHLHKAYQEGGSRAFDAGFMARVFERPFEVLYVEDADSIAASHEEASAIGRHLNGCRIGFDAGGSDRKVSAVVDGETVYAEEVIWHPKVTKDPTYHREEIRKALQTAASHMPRVDAIGVSSAGVYIDNKIMIASLFLAVPDERFDGEVKNMYIDLAREMGNVPLVVANDGDVTALAGAMSMEKGNVLGIAMGTSEAGGYVDEQMRVTGWLNELAFVPVDANPEAMVDEWSGDFGCGVKYFSQDAVIKLAPAAGIDVSHKKTPAEKLVVVQDAMKEGHAGARQIYETIGVYFGYALAWYALFYEIDEALIMGRVSSGEGGDLVIKHAQEVLAKEFPELASKMRLSLPDEKARRVGQSVAAASLPMVENK